MSAVAESSTTAAAADGANRAVALQEVQETMSRLSAHKGVQAVVILNPDGNIVSQSGKPEVLGNAMLLRHILDLANRYSSSMPMYKEEPTEVSFITIRYQQEEILVAPKNGYVLVVVQDPSEISRGSD